VVPKEEQTGVGLAPALRELLRIAAPAVAASTSYTMMQFADKWMVSRIGPDPVYVGAQGVGGLAAWIPMSFMYGLLAVVNTFVSQNMGAGKSDRGPAYAWNALWLACIAWVPMIAYGLVLPSMFHGMYEPERAALASQYGQILVFGSILSMATRGMAQYFYGMHKPGIVLIAGLSGNVVNIFFNWVLIFGNLGAPRLEMAGAAYATLIGLCVEGAIPFFVFLGPAMHRAYGTRRQWRPSAERMKEIWRLGWPAGTMFGNEMICWGFFMIYLVGKFGKEHATAGIIAQQWMSLSFMPAVGLSIAVSATVGKYIGMRRTDLAANRAWVALGAAMLYMGACAVLFIVLRGPMVSVFIPADMDEAARANVMRLGGLFLIACATFQIFDAVAMVLSGALRGAGDTKWVGVATVVLSWGMIVGGGQALVWWAPSLGSLGPWIAASAYIIVLAIVILLRFTGGKWRRMSVVKEGPARVG
jgi:MATE family multidrug resistance protein